MKTERDAKISHYAAAYRESLSFLANCGSGEASPVPQQNGSRQKKTNFIRFLSNDILFHFMLNPDQKW